MTKIKIKSNPYTKEISYQTLDVTTGDWLGVKQSDKRSRLTETGLTPKSENLIKTP